MPNSEYHRIGQPRLLGSSLGGELLNPGAPELQTVSTALNIPSTECVARVAPLLLVHLAVATALFWALCSWAETPSVAAAGSPPAEKVELSSEAAFRVHYLKAAVPLVPLVLLFLTGPPLQLLGVPREWLIGADEPPRLRPDSRLIGAAMLVGVAAAAVVAWRSAGGVAWAFFNGAGYAFTHIISLIVSANCFGEGVKAIGLAALLGQAIDALPALLVPSAAAFPLAFAVVSGSGFASTQSLFGFFVQPSDAVGIHPANVGAVVSLAAAAGRTMSPVAAVTLMCASMTDTTPLALARRVAGPLLAGLGVVLLLRAVLQGG
jgi:DcuC family C4-dicarboxylate transporter